MATMTGGQLAAQTLVEQGVEKIFTLSGGHITPIYQYLEETSIRLVDTRHEQAAVFMAEAWGKMTRRAGVAMVTAGPGFTNALTGVASAMQSNTPLVLVCGAVGMETREKLDLQDMPQEPVIRSLVKKTLVCQKTERVPEFVELAFRHAESGRPGPVYLEIPVDVLNAAVDEDAVHRAATRVVSRPVDLDGAARLLEMLEAAEKPVLIGGTGIWQADAGEELTRLIEATNLPLFTSLSGRGVVSDDHPLCFEGALAIRPGGAFAAYLETDLVILLGTRVCLYYMFGQVFNPAARLVQVDICAEEIGRNRRVDLPIVSDAGALVAALNRRLAAGDGGKRLRERFAPWVASLQKAHADGKAAAEKDWSGDLVPIHPLRLAREVDRFMDRDTDVVVADGGDTTTWMGMTRTCRHPGRYLDYGIFGSLAVGLPYAIAAQLRYPDSRVALITGDGSVGFNFMEFENALRKGLPIVAVISNDQGWGMIRHSQELRIGHAIADGTWIGRVDYHRMVAALGGFGALVEDPEEIRPTLEAAFASGRTACINVMTDTTTVSPGSMALANVGAYKA